MKFSTNSELWTSYLSLLASVPTDNNRTREKIDICKMLIPHILEDMHEWDAYTQVTRKNLGSHITEALQRRNPSESDIRKIFLFLARCVREKEINSSIVPQGVEKRALEYYSQSTELSEDESRERDYLSGGFIKLIVAELGLGIDEKRKEVDGKIAVWEKKIVEFDTRLEKGEALVDRYQRQFNFVGLSSAFQDLASRKSKEQSKHLALLVGVATLLVIPPLLQFWYDDVRILHISSGTLASLNFGKLVPLLILDGLLLYFFRIILKNYYSAKAQVLQLELRYSICAFVEGYADFVKTKALFKDGESALSKFESLIFSGIAADETKIPSTFDGLDQISDFIAKIKK